jgi:hypothetical protein
MDLKDWQSKNPWLITEIGGSPGLAVGDKVTFGQELVDGQVEIVDVICPVGDPGHPSAHGAHWKNVTCKKEGSNRERTNGSTNGTAFAITSSKPETKEQLDCRLDADLPGNPFESGASWTAVEGGGGTGGVRPPKRPNPSQKPRAL